jgi:hypothetical protein
MGSGALNYDPEPKVSKAKVAELLDKDAAKGR